MSEKIAVIGAGISGLAAAYLLNQSGKQVTLFEKNARIGGHAHTNEVRFGEHTVPVDTGFIVFNDRNYPNLVKLFKHLDVASEASDMSFAVSLDNGAFEYATAPLDALFAQRRHLLTPKFYKMLWHIIKFHEEAPDAANDPANQNLTVGEFLKREGYHDWTIQRHFVPMGAAIWSTPAQQMLEFPLLTFVRFCQNHGLIQIKGRPQWRTVTGGSRSYVTKLVSALDGRITASAGVNGITRREGGVTVHRDGAPDEDFDAVLLATHADEAFALLRNPSEDERAVLGAFRTTPNTVVLHSDAALMPRRRKVWSAWNYLGNSDGSNRNVSLTYWMNRLQNIPPQFPLYVTVNPGVQPKAELTHATHHYTHPQYTMASFRAQQELYKIQGKERVWYAGAYFSYGFHEDGLTAGMNAARGLGAVIGF
ncbi:MAG: FAD-dependent oxidoreductase [Alphaproteobacteria bacterium]|nr:FAD-dependent oxidoreductase [Alphaproteobacteria bacterium]